MEVVDGKGGGEAEKGQISICSLGGGIILIGMKDLEENSLDLK